MQIPASFMKKILLASAFVCLTAGLSAQIFDGGNLLPPDSARRNNQSQHRSRPNQQEKQEEKTLDGRKPSDRLELQRPMHRHITQPSQPKEAKPAEPSDAAKPVTTMKPGMLPNPVSGPGNPLAPPPKIKYPTMPPGKKVFECSYCHYIYYTNYMPDIVKCDKPGLYHDWHLIGLKGTIWFRCINCNTHVCCTKTPIRSQCDLETKHVWEVVGQLTPKQQKQEIEKEQD